MRAVRAHSNTSTEETQCLIESEEGASQVEGVSQEGEEEEEEEEEGEDQVGEQSRQQVQPLCIQYQVVFAGIIMMCVLDGTMYGNVIFKRALREVRCVFIFLLLPSLLLR